MNSRRTFLRNLLLFPSLLTSCRKNNDNSHFEEDLFDHQFNYKITFRKNCTLLFIGDSITEGYRDKNILLPNDEKGLGEGFVKEIALELLKKEQLKIASIYNRGISGNITSDLLRQWDNGAIELKPDVISILVGVNDLKKFTAFSTYYNAYQAILSTIKTRLPNATIVLCEPFILPNISGYDEFKPLFHQYRKVIRRLSIDFKSVFVSNCEAFESQAQVISNENLLYDGIHPTNTGINILKDQWLKACAF